MTFLVYLFFVGNQLMVGMAEFDTMQRCRDALPQAQLEHPDGGAACIPVKRP